MISDQESQLVDKAVDSLLEHFDTVRIFVTRTESPKEQTLTYTTGGGNIYAQLGFAIEWVEWMKAHGSQKEGNPP